jgi:hypothetical protein
MSAANLWPYWSVDIPGMDEEQGLKILEAAERLGLKQGNSLLNPALFLSLHIEKTTVEALIRALDVAQANAASELDDHQSWRSMQEILKEWTDQALDD